MKSHSIACAAFVAIATSVPAIAAPVTDCPLRDAPFSTSTPLIDILLSPVARETLEREAEISFENAPPQFLGTSAPTFAAILTLRELAGFTGQSPDKFAKAAAALESIEVTNADRIARCARYDDKKPEFELPEGKPAFLLFEKIIGFKDVPSVDAARGALIEIAERNDWTIVSSDHGGAISPEILARFDAVIWNNISGDVLTLSQRQALRDYVEGGGGFVALHGSGGDPVYFWDWYADTLIGARFAGHPRDPQFQDARIVLEDASHPAAADLPDEWVMNDEWYSFRTNPRDGGARIIARLDESSYDPSAGFGDALRMGDDHPIAWSRIIGKGRSFYSAIGHRPETYSHPFYNSLIEDALAWAAALDEPDCGD